MSQIHSDKKTLLDNIQSLQSMEKQLYSDLESVTQNDIDEQARLIDKINMMSSSRMHLFKNLALTHDLIEDVISSKKDDVSDKIKLVHSYENQLNEMKNEINKREDLNVNNLRLTEINTYYSKKYNAYFQIFKKIAIICILLIIVAVLRQRYMITPRVANILAIIIIIVACIMIIPTLFDLSARNNMVFDEYDFTLEPPKKDNSTINVKNNINYMKDMIELGLSEINNDTKSYAENSQAYTDNLKLLAEGDCVGPHCCTAAGLKYDDKTNSCAIMENFESMKKPQLPFGLLSDPDTYSKSLVIPRNPMVYSIH